MKMIITYDDDDYYFTEPQKKKNFNFYLKVRNMRENFSSPSFFFIFLSYKFHRNRVEKKR